MLAVDTGTSRNVADVARIMGMDIKAINGVSAVARRMAMGMERNVSKSLSVQETLQWIEKHSAALKFAFEVTPKNKIGITQASVRAVLARAYYRRPVEDTRSRVAVFGNILMTGLPENPKTDSAAINVRNFLQDHLHVGNEPRVRAPAISPLVVYAKTEMALDKFLRYENVESLRETSQELFWLPGEDRSVTELRLADEEEIMTA